MSKWFLDLFRLLSNGRQRVGAFLDPRACRKNAFKHNRIQSNAGTACTSECVLKTLACRGLRVGPSEAVTVMAVPRIN